MNGFYIAVIGCLMSASADEGFKVALTVENAGALSIQGTTFLGTLAPRYQCVLEKVDRPFEAITLPQPRALRMLEHGQVDVVMPLVQTRTRDQYASFAKPLLTVRYLLYTLPETLLSDSNTDLNIATVWSSAIVTWITRAGHEISPVESHRTAIEMVKRRRVDGLVMPEPTAQSMPEELLGLSAVEFGTLDAGMYVSKSNSALLDAINFAIDECFSIPNW